MIGATCSEYRSLPSGKLPPLSGGPSVDNELELEPEAVDK